MKNNFIILSLVLSNLLFAQPAGSIVGTVLDKDLNNEPLPFANILIPEVNVGTTSDFDGLFSLDGLTEGDYIVHFSFVGYETQKVPVTVVGGKVTEIQVSLASSSSALDEVIVTTFTAGQQTTLPIWMFQELIRPRQRPVTNVVAVVMIGLTFIPIVLAYWLTRTNEDARPH